MMANMADCLARAIQAGDLDSTRGQAAIAEYEQLVARYSSIMSEPQARARAQADLREATRHKVAARRHKVLAQLQAMRRIDNLIKTSKDPARALQNLLEFAEGSGFKGESVRSLTEAYEGMINADIAEVLQQVGLNVTGANRNKALLTDVIRELHGQATGNAMAKGLAAAVTKAEHRMVQQFNAHGGNVKILKDRGVPHSHDPLAMQRAGYDTWASTIERQLDWSRIDDFQTGKPFADAPGSVPPRAVTDRFLRDVYQGIITKGADDLDPSMSPGGRALYAQRAEHRVLHFKDGDAWMAYAKEFAATDPFSAMVNGLHGLARDVAQMRVLGPNPRAGLTYAEQVARRRAADLGDTKLATRVDRNAKRARAMLAHIDGSANVPEHEGWASFFAGTRSVLTSIQLGSAVLSSVTDVATMTAASQAVGMNAARVLTRSVKLMASQASRQTAARMGYVAGTLADAGGGYSRFMGKTFSSGIPDRLAGFTLRATGLSFVTDMRKMAFQMEFAGFMADNADRAFDAIDAPLRAIFQARGITPADWDALRAPEARFVADDGADFISPYYWLETQTSMPKAEANGLALRLQMAMQEQLEYAIPTQSVEGTVLMRDNTRPGNIPGEVMRSVATYKSFTMSLMLGQYRRFMNQPTPLAKAKYAAKMSAMLWVMGALAIQLKEVAKGNDPRPMDNRAFWAAALLQGGGVGIFGDFFASETNRVGGGFAQTLLGPVFGSAVPDAVGFVSENLAEVYNGKDVNLGRDVINVARKYTPFLSSAWMVRTAYSRLVMDELQTLLDPGAQIAFNRKLRALQRDYGTQPFVPTKGSNDTLRMPNFGNAFGAQE
jgi:hypothetical protein